MPQLLQRTSYELALDKDTQRVSVYKHGQTLIGIIAFTPSRLHMFEDTVLSFPIRLRYNAEHIAFSLI